MKKVELIYIGRRILDAEKGILARAFVKKLGGKEIYWTKARWCSIGYKYLAKEKADGLTMDVVPERTGEANLTEAQREELESKDAAAEAVARNIKLVKKADTKAKGVAQESHALRRIVRGMSYTEKREFINAVIDEIESLEDKRAKP